MPTLEPARSMLAHDAVPRGLGVGRTPKINRSAGRDHWPYVYSYLIGGAGLPGGRVIGASDVQGAYPVATPVTPERCAEGVFTLMGLDVNVKLRAENLVSDSRGIPGLLGESVAPWWDARGGRG